MSSELYALKNQLTQKGIFYCSNGPATYEMLVNIGEVLKEALINSNVKQSTINKIFTVFVEQFENIVRYSDEKIFYPKENKFVASGLIIVGIYNYSYFVECGNLIKNSKTKIICEKLDKIINMNKDQLKNYYKQKRKQDSEEHSKGAGIGLIDIARKTSKPIEYSIIPINGQFSFFSIKAVI